MDIHHFLRKATEQRDSGALQSAYSLLKSTGTSRLAPRITPDLYVVCAEAALQLGCLEISTACLKMFFEENPPANQFLCRAYLCQGQLQSPPSAGTVEEFEEAVLSFLKAIEIAKSDPGCSFMVFNASVLYFHTVRRLLQPGRCGHLVASLRQVVRSLEEVADQDHSWRAELMMHLIRCLVDSGNLDEAASSAKITEQFIKSNSPHLYPRLCMLQVKHNLQEKEVLVEKSVYKMQDSENSLEEPNKSKPTEELEKIFHLLKHAKASTDSSCPQSPTPIHPADRVAFLLELALLALELKHQKVAADCLKELKSAGEASDGQRIIMECVKCEINILKRGAKMNDYSKASVEARLKEIGKLDEWLQTAVREGDPQAMQAVCATQWSLCLPLLQHNLRKNIKAPLLRVSQVLEDMQSMLLEMRCQVHSELAVIEEEEGRLEAALTHLQKASLLDNGKQQDRLSSALRLLQLRGTVYQTPPRAEDKAAMLMQQAKDMMPKDKAGIRPVLAAVGLLLAPDDFQTVLDADNISKSSPGSGPASQLSAKAQHHSACVQRAEGHLATQGNNTERVGLWVTLVKTARKQEVWDVCRAASRFCLLYDDSQRKISKTDTKMMKDPQTDDCESSAEESCADALQSCTESPASVKHLLRLLAEIHLISAEATVHKLLTEGVQLNGPAVPAVDGGVCLSEDDPHFVIYRDWIQALSAYATCSFLRAAELGAEIGEPWLITNAAVYLWNYSSHLLAEGEYQRLLPTFQSLVQMLRDTQCTGSRSLFVLLCDAVARGLIQPLCGAGSVEPAPPAEKKSKNRSEKASSAHGVSFNPAALQDVHKAAELSDYAMNLSNTSEESVPIAVRKRVVSTWVQIKRLLQQQISSSTDTMDESEKKEVSEMMHVLVGVEMLQCNRNPRHMEFSVPSLSTLVSMASECSWTDAVVELQVWCQLASFCHDAEDHGLVLCCTEKALQLEEAAAKTLNTVPCVLYGPTAVNEMLSAAMCLRASSLVSESRGNVHTYREALQVLLSGVSFAEKAEDPALCAAAGRHYWNTCLPLTQTPEERETLREPLETILTALDHTNNKHKRASVKGSLTFTAPSSTQEATNKEDLSLRAAIYSLLCHIHTDQEDWKSALLILDRAVRDIPDRRLRLRLLKQRVLVKTRLGICFLSDMKKLQDEGEQCCSWMWHQVALCSDSVSQQLSCYQKSITSLSSAEAEWQKVNLLLEFGEWLYFHNFPKTGAEQHVQWAVDILLKREAERGAEDDNKSSEESESAVGVQGSLYTQSLSDLKGVRRLDSLIRAHTLLAVMADRNTPEHQLNLLRAYTLVLHMWQVSMAVCCEISSERAKSRSSQPPPSAGSRTGKDKGKGKKHKDPPPADERPKPVVLNQELPSTPNDWARFVCPEQARQIFRTNNNPHCVNTHSVTKQTQSLSFLNLLTKELNSLSLGHLTLPIMHLAETIAHDLLEQRSLSDLYRLRIVRACCQLGLEAQSPDHQQLLNLSRIPEQEQMACRREIAFLQERRGLHKNLNERVPVGEKSSSGRLSVCVCARDIWLEKAEVCLSIGLIQPARQLMAEAHLVATELGDQRATARSLLSLAVLACEEQNFSQSLILLDKAKDLGGDEEFWYQFTLTKVRAVVAQGHEDASSQVDQIIEQGCDALRLVLDQRVNRVQELTFFITSLKMRGAVERVCDLSDAEPEETLCKEAEQRLKAACDALTQCAHVFTSLNYRQHAAEAHGEGARLLRVLANHASSSEDRRRFLLCSFSEMQLAVSEQEIVVLNARRLLPLQEESSGLSLAAARRLLRLRLDLAEFSLVLLEEQGAEEKRRAVSRQTKASAEMALEEFTRCSPEPGSLEEDWLSICSTVGQVALSQLAAVRSASPDHMETRAGCLSLMGKYLRLLALQEDPLYVCALWDPHKQTGTRSDPADAASVEQESDGQSGSREPRAKSAELQRRRRRAQQLLAQARKALTEATSLCLQHKLPSSILSEASLNMLECHGQSDPAVSGQYLALFQSCCSVATMADVLTSACSGSSESQLSALLSLHTKLLLSQEERPSSMLKGAEDSLISLSKTFSHLSINAGHLNILEELPPTLKLLLLQHSADGSELYGAFYEAAETPNQKAKTSQAAGTLTCSRVAKASVCPRALLALREQTRSFGQETRLAFFRETCRQTWHAGEDVLEVSEEQRVFPYKPASEQTLSPRFTHLLRAMEDYLEPLLSQFDFSGFRRRAASLPVPEMTKDEEEKESAEPGQYVVLLADRKLLEFPLEALMILQEDGVTSVSRDFSLQLLHSRLNREEPQKVESDNKKETKGGKGMKGKADQSQAIKAMPLNAAFPSHTVPADTRHFKYVVDPHHEGSFDGTSLSSRMEEILETHGHLWEGFMGSKQTPSLSEMQQLLSRCSTFIYLGMERFMANVPPGKLAALDLSGCRMALLFDLLQNRASVLRQKNLDMHKRAEQLTLENPLQAALLLSLGGVGCVVLTQWHSSLQQNAHRVASVLHDLLKVRLTSGQAVHALRTAGGSERKLHDQGDDDDVQHKTSLSPSAFSVILYGLPNVRAS